MQARLFLSKAEDTIVLLDDRQAVVCKGNSHHGAAHQDLFRRNRIPSAEADDLCNRRTDRNNNVLRGFYGGAVDGDALLHQRHPCPEIIGQEGNGRYVHHNTTHICRQLPHGDLASGAGLDEHLFRSLRVGSGKRQHTNVFVRAGLSIILHLPQCFDYIGLIVFHRYDRPLNSQHLPDRIDSGKYRLCVFQRFPMVGRYVWFALRSVDNERVNVLIGGYIQLDMCRKTSAAQSNQAGLPHSTEKLLAGIHLWRMYLWRNLHLSIGVDHKRIHILAPREHHLVDRMHFA